MMCFTKWVSAVVATSLLAGTAVGADTVSNGKVKSINADDKTFVVTDATDKDFTFKFGDHLVINRAGKEGKSDLKAGDAISVCYDKGLLTWTAHYILVQEGSTKSFQLVNGNFKSYDAGKKQMLFTGDGAKTSTTYAMGDADVRLNMKSSKIEAIEIGDHALLIVEMTATTPTLKSVMVNRK
jgi:hypothetical protein